MFTLQQLQSGEITPELLGSEKRFKLSQGLTEFPLELFAFAEQIEILDLGGNELSDLPDDFYRFSNLKILFLTDNVFEHVPEVLAQCEKLEMIAFKSNRVKTVAENSLPRSTRWLILTNNQIESLPHSMGELTQLRKLALAGNQLSSLPASMENCRELELVRLAANQLATLPEWLLSLPKLAWLGFSGNPVCGMADLSRCDLPRVDLANFQLNQPLGEGASGVIYHAHITDAVEHNEVAVKLFKGSITSDGYPQDEMQCCIQSGEHPNLIRVLSYITQADQLGLVMELIPSKFSNLGLPPSLQSCTRDTFAQGMQFTSDRILKIAKHMANTLLHLHDRNISHGDIYAHNIMVTDDAQVLFGDFGAASDLNNLTRLQRQQMQAIEVRAFAYLLDDLLALAKHDGLHAQLLSICQMGLNRQLSLGSTFATIARQLDELSA